MMSEYPISASNTARGCDMYFDSTANASKTNLIQHEGNLYAVIAYNPNTSDVFLQLFDDLASDVTLGVTTPSVSLPIPAGSSSTGGGMENVIVVPVNFDNAISYAVTTTATGSSTPSSDIVLNIFYK